MEQIIREMTHQDWPQVSQIYQEGLRTNVASFEQTLPTYPQWDSAHLNILRFVCLHQGQIVGWVALSPVSSRAVYRGVGELSIYIGTQYHGLGIATALLTHLLKESAQQGLWMIQSVILSNNAPSIQWHKKMGFRTVGYREKIAQDRLGQWQDTTLMELRNDIGL